MKENIPDLDTLENEFGVEEHLFRYLRGYRTQTEPTSEVLMNSTAEFEINYGVDLSKVEMDFYWH